MEGPASFHGVVGCDVNGPANSIVAEFLQHSAGCGGIHRRKRHCVHKHVVQNAAALAPRDLVSYTMDRYRIHGAFQTLSNTVVKLSFSRTRCTLASSRITSEPLKS